MTTEKRLDNIEDRVDKIVDLLEGQQSLLEGQQRLMSDMVTVLKRHSEILDSHAGILAEMRRDNAYTRKLWVLAARKLDLLDELPPEDDDEGGA